LRALGVPVYDVRIMIDTQGLVMGELAIREQLVTPEQLEAAVSRQREIQFEKKLGEILVEQGAMTQEKMDDLLTRQKDALKQYEKAISAGGLFGRLAMEFGLVHPDKLADAIRRQLYHDRHGIKAKIGQILVWEGALSIEGFWKILQMQTDFKCPACHESLNDPKFGKMAILCSKCGKPAIVLDDPTFPSPGI